MISFAHSITGKAGLAMNRDAALNLLKEYNKEAFHLQHALTVEAVMRWFSEALGYPEEADFWAMAGLLHDIDFERYPQEHCAKSAEILREAGFDSRFIHAVCSHGYGIMPTSPQPLHQMEQVLFAADELTGLIGAAALMRPSRSVQDMELKSLKKKFKDKSFAAGCSRETIRQGAEMLGWELDALMEQTLAAMRATEESVQAGVAAL